MELTLYHQNMMCALRLEMGWPAFKPANDCLRFSAGKAMDVPIGMELARIATMLGKDVIYAGWASTKATRPIGFSLAYREIESVDVINNLLPYAANDTAPLTLVSIRGDEVFAIDRRGTLLRLPGKPKDIHKGRDLAMKRIKARAAAMADTLLAGNRFVPSGQDWVEPEAEPEHTIVRFG